MKTNGGSDIRLFTLPGVYYCLGGPGADTFDPLAALEGWVQKGVEPNSMVAKNRAGGF